jgi:cytochrome c-type biogenesis protein CcmH/NrfG
VAYQRAVQLKPEVSGFQAALGRAYLTKGDRGRSLAAYSKALALDPNNQAAKSALASLKH